MRIKVIGFNAGQFGDLVMNTVVAKQFKQKYPNSTLVFGVGPQYYEILPLFYQHPYIDNFHIYETYDGWPNNKDIEYLNKNKYNYIFNPFPKHISDDWWRFRHQTQEACLMNGVEDNGPEQCILNKWFSVENNSDVVAFAAFAGYYNPNNNKKLSFKNAQEIVDFLIKSGYKVLQIGGKNEPKLEGTIKKDFTYFDSLKNALSCKFYIGTDTGMTWATSSYSMPTVGLYCSEMYGEGNIKNIQPINPNARYLSNININNITIDEISNIIKTL